ncbi:MAG TPA: SirB2 family protein, partial [Burkholderiaceae bacterium]
MRPSSRGRASTDAKAENMDYLALRAFHETTVAVSVTGFAARAAAGLAGARWSRGRLARTLPHVVDTAL